MTVVPAGTEEPAAGEVLATSPTGTGAPGVAGPTSTAKPASRRVFSAASSGCPVTSGTSTVVPRLTVGSAPAKSFGGRSCSALLIICCQIAAGTVPPYTSL